MDIPAAHVSRNISEAVFIGKSLRQIVVQRDILDPGKIGLGRIAIVIGIGISQEGRVLLLLAAVQ